MDEKIKEDLGEKIVGLTLLQAKELADYLKDVSTDRAGRAQYRNTLADHVPKPLSSGNQQTEGKKWSGRQQAVKTVQDAPMAG